MKKYSFIIFFSSVVCLICCSSNIQKTVEKRDFNKNNSRDFDLIAGGDLICGSYVQNAVLKYGYEYPFKQVKGIIDEADVAFANLECVICDKGKIRSHHPNKKNYDASEDAYKSIIYSGIDVFSIANNHVMDKGSEGLVDFVNIMNSSPLYAGGSGKNIAEAEKPVNISVNGVNVSFIFFSAINSKFGADKYTPGYNYIDISDKDRSEKKLREVLSLIPESTEIIIMSIHWGPNYTTETSNFQKAFAHLSIDLGIDLILGHSAHIFHGIEVYKNKPIIYDMGDLLINDDDSWDTRSFLYKISFIDSNPHGLELIPIYMPNSQIRVSEGIIADETIARMVSFSKKLNTALKVQENRIYIEFDK